MRSFAQALLTTVLCWHVLCWCVLCLQAFLLRKLKLLLALRTCAAACAFC